ncbi:cis-prenyltransferase 4, chloroplastic [Capsicum galapagoense]
MAFSLHLQQIFLSSTTFSSQPKSQIFPNLIKKTSIPPLIVKSSLNASASTSAAEKEIRLPPELSRELMPKHVAVIMDGNRRWAKNRGLPVALGYEAGIRSVRKLVELCGNWGINALTLFAFSSENWSRPKVEVDILMGLFEKMLKSELETLASIFYIGSWLSFVKPVNNDVVQACQTIAQKVKDGIIEPEDISSFLVEQELQTNCTDFPCPDLLIRTSGELRLSNFLLWQLAYTELYFSNAQWPDFGEAEFSETLCSFQQRQRRYGGQDS